MLPCRSTILCYNQGGKCQDISAIYRVLGGVDTIFRGEKSKGRYLCKYCQNIGDISARGDISEIFWKNRLWWQNIGDLSPIYCRYFDDISPPSCNVIWRLRLRLCWSDCLNVIPMVKWRSNYLNVIPMVIWRSNSQIAPSFWSNDQNWFSTEN